MNAQSQHGSDEARRSRQRPSPCFLGIDVGAESIKLAEVARESSGLRWTRRSLLEHNKEPARALRDLLGQVDWSQVGGAAVTGRFGKLLRFARVPIKQCQARAFRFLGDAQPATLVSIGSHGFSVLELRPNNIDVFRENSRCSQGTGNFLRQLVERYSLGIEEASVLASGVDRSAPLSGRCPVILKSDMTHLANKGEDRARILAGLFDAVCENVRVLLKPGLSPARLVLLGGVSRSARVQQTFREFALAHGMTLWPLDGDDGLYFEALGSALLAAESEAIQAGFRDRSEPQALERQPAQPPAAASPCVDRWLAQEAETKIERVPSLAMALGQVRRMPAQPLASIDGPVRPLILGLDIGSTGSKAVAIDASSGFILWQGYRQTLGDPVGSAQALLRQFAEHPAKRHPVVAVGVTGSGREIVGSLLTTCYGKEAVFVLNEIAAHAEGALHYDRRVDTIFEIGGQDAKYIRLAEGRVVDCAMNEACSAGTGSFIEEQGRKFSGVRDVVHLGQEALLATEGVSLGQHCSVFMAEIIDEAVAGGVDQRSIIAGLYDSVVQNYLHRVKGNRSVGQVIFCQGMPFASDALAAAVARQTGGEVVIPPNPGTVGSLGIALLTRAGTAWRERAGLDLRLVLSAHVEAKDNFLCKATVGCGGNGNRCRIDRLRTVVESQRQVFTWGGGCALHDKGTRKRKLPDLAPDPFREREELVKRLAERLVPPAGATSSRPTAAISDEFMLKGLFPFFATFLRESGLDLLVVGGGDHLALKRGIQEANVPYCAPMQQFHGLSNTMAETGADFLFLPMVRSLPRVDGEPHAVTCPIVQASPDLLRWDMGKKGRTRILSPVVNVGLAGLESAEFIQSCRSLWREIGGEDDAVFERAHRLGVQAQLEFERQCPEIGARALEFCRQHGIVPVVVLGRPYTIYNTVLNSNIPAILREQGAVGIPVDCYPVGQDAPVFPGMFWSYGQRILRAAHQVRRTQGEYALYCSNYSCGPDSFNLHFFAYVMEGKPFAIIETDGHSGDAGTKTRVEAFLHCVAQDLDANGPRALPTDFQRLHLASTRTTQAARGQETLIVPWIGINSRAVASCFRAAGFSAEALPQPDADALRLGRRHTSGKECLPMCLALGSVLQRAQHLKNPEERLTVLMPSTHGPCREGAYNTLIQMTLERLGWDKQVRLWTLQDSGYFESIPSGLSVLLFSAIMASDLLMEALHDTRPVETRPGAANEIYRRHFERMLRLIETVTSKDLSMRRALWQVATGRFFGLGRLLHQATSEFAAVRTAKELPTVALVGEIYVRLDPFANNFLIEKLEERGLRVRLAPFSEWLEYSDRITSREEGKVSLASRLSSLVQSRIRNLSTRRVGRRLGWHDRTTVADSLEAVAAYLRSHLRGEAVLTVGSPVHEWRHGQIDGVVSVGPLECMPNKIAEAQFFHVSEQEGLLTLTLPVNGDPIDAEILDSFAFEVHSRFKRPSPQEAAVRRRQATMPAAHGCVCPGSGPTDPAAHPPTCACACSGCTMPGPTGTQERGA